MSRCFTWFLVSGLEEPEIYQNLVCFTRKGGFYLEELVGVTHRGMMGVGFSVGLLFYSSVPQSYFDEISYYILFFSPSVLF